MYKKRLSIAVSGLNATDNPGPGVPVIRSIRHSPEFDGIITGLAFDPLDPGIYMQDVCDNVFLMPYPSQGADHLLERIKEVHSKIPLDVVIPTLDSELDAYIRINGKLEEMGIRSFLPSAEGLNVRSKAYFDRLSEMGITVPHGQSITSVASIYELERKFKYPVMVKGQFYEAYIAHSPMDAEYYFRKISAKWGLPVVVQEFVVGQEYDIMALGDGRGGLVGAVAIKKLQLTEKGKAWGGITIDDPAMDECVCDIIAKLRWRGPCELEMIKSRETGDYYLIEINPRFPAWCYLSAGAGQNLPWATVKLALNEPVQALPACQIGSLFLRNSIDHVYPISKYKAILMTGELIGKTIKE
jgi:carbamoyl-phosphate synthase large subunit